MKTTLRHVTPREPANWETYHAIRRSLLWDGGKRYDYRSDHPDDTAAGNFTMLFLVADEPVGVVRIDVRNKKKEAVFRQLAIAPSHQRKGYGTLFMKAAEDFARGKNCETFIASITPDVMPFYLDLGYTLHPSCTIDSPSPRMTKAASTPTPPKRKISNLFQRVLRLPKIPAPQQQGE